MLLSLKKQEFINWLNLCSTNFGISSYFNIFVQPNFKYYTSKKSNNFNFFFKKRVPFFFFSMISKKFFNKKYKGLPIYMYNFDELETFLKFILNDRSFIFLFLFKFLNKSIILYLYKKKSLLSLSNIKHFLCLSLKIVYSRFLYNLFFSLFLLIGLLRSIIKNK